MDGRSRVHAIKKHQILKDAVHKQVVLVTQSLQLSQCYNSMSYEFMSYGLGLTFLVMFYVLSIFFSLNDFKSCF